MLPPMNGRPTLEYVEEKLFPDEETNVLGEVIEKMEGRLDFWCPHHGLILEVRSSKACNIGSRYLSAGEVMEGAS